MAGNSDLEIYLNGHAPALSVHKSRQPRKHVMYNPSHFSTWWGGALLSFTEVKTMRIWSSSFSVVAPTLWNSLL